MELEGAVQNYAWGNIGSSSSVAKLSFAGYINEELDLNESLPYAELWMGTHPSGPSIIKASGSLLKSYIDDHHYCLGSNITSKFGKELCFLFKVLSVKQALSIQAHPEKLHAEELHGRRPEIYKDPNHKPEMAIALTPFQALCGFRPAVEIQAFFSELSELKVLIGEENTTGFKLHPSEDTLKKCFSALMNAPTESVADALNKLSERFLSADDSFSSKLLKDIFLMLYKQYPDDSGCFAIFFLNYIVLQPGEAMFLGPNVIHAYLNGDCVECMACSDNVVRAGLTPKFKDVDTLLDMLEYKMLSAELRKFEGKKVNDYTTVFNPPVPDFAVQKIEESSKQTLQLTVEKSASILIVIQGSGHKVQVNPVNEGGIDSPQSIREGSILFLAAGQKLSFQVDNVPFLAFRALCLYDEAY